MLKINPFSAFTYTQDTFSRLCQLLDQAGLPYVEYPGYLLISFEAEGIDFLEDGTQVDLIATWNEDVVTIQVNLMDLAEEEQDAIDPVLLASLLQTNYAMNICKFGFSPYGLSLLVDYDIRYLEAQEVALGIDSLLFGVQIYLNILAQWLDYVQQETNLDFDSLNDEYWDDYIDQMSQIGLEDAKAQGGQQEGLQAQVVRTLMGVGKVGLTAGILAGVATTAGIPAAGIGTILAAVAAQSGGKSS